MYEVMKNLKTFYKRSHSTLQGNYLWSLTTNCGQSAFISNMVQFDWFDWAVFSTSSSALSSGVQGYSELKRAHVLRAAVVVLALVEQIFWVYLACSLDWNPSLGRWYAIRATKLGFQAYWMFFAHQALEIALAAFLARAFMSVGPAKASRHSENAETCLATVDADERPAVRRSDDFSCGLKRRARLRQILSLHLLHQHCNARLLNSIA